MQDVIINLCVAIIRKYGEWNVYQYTIQFQPDISSDIQQNPVPVNSKNAIQCIPTSNINTAVIVLTGFQFLTLD